MRVMLTFSPSGFRSVGACIAFAALLSGTCAPAQVKKRDKVWAFSMREYHDPLHSEPRAAHTQVLFPAVSDAFQYVVKPGRRLVWDISLGSEIPLFGYQSNATEDAGGVREGQFGFGLWFPVSFHMIEDMGKDPSNPILNTDYRFGAMAKGQYGLKRKLPRSDETQVGFRFQLGHESTHIGDEFTLAASRLYGNNFKRVNVSYEYWEAGGSVDPSFGQDGVWRTKFRGGLIRLLDQKKGWYDSSLLQPFGQAVPASRRNYEPYFGWEIYHARVARYGFFASVDIRNRTVFNYEISPNVEENTQLSMNLLVGCKLGRQAQGQLGKLRPAYFIRLYHGVNPAGQFRNQADYSLIGFGVQFFR